MSRPVVALLYVPADRPDRIGKALASGADGVIVDLEDAVAPSAKETARASLGLLAEAPDDLQVQVRINAVGTPWHDADVAAVGVLPVRVGARIPKAERVEDVDALAQALPDRDLHLLIESALGVERAFDLAGRPQVATLGLGEADLMADLSASAEGLGWVRGRVVNAARAAGLPSPLMSAYTHVRDHEGLAASCRAGRGLGFLGRSAIHPGQIAVIREAFRPSPEETARARTILERLEGSVAAGVGALQLADGTFLDLAMVESARRTIALSSQQH